jgi:hypothetical protein
MAINPNSTFTAGAVYTADQSNRFPRGIMAYASSASNYTLTATMTQATGMTVTFVPSANRNYKITYYEPAVETASVTSAITTLRIYVGTTAGTQLNQGILQTSAAVKILGTVVPTAVTSALGTSSVTIIGAANTTSVTGTPVLQRLAVTPAFLLVEDIGPA